MVARLWMEMSGRGCGCKVDRALQKCPRKALMKAVARLCREGFGS